MLSQYTLNRKDTLTPKTLSTDLETEGMATSTNSSNSSVRAALES